MAFVTKRKNEEKSGGEVQDLLGPDAVDARRAKADMPDDSAELPSEEDSQEDDAPAKGGGKPVIRKDPKSRSRPAQFFTIYKNGQGYWTRMGTAIGAGILGLMLAFTLYDKLPSFFPHDQAFGKKLGVEVAVGFLVVFCLVVWPLTNKPANVDFLIATDSEMKKVNWTSRKELTGSTKVVIIFMMVIAIFLFSVDELWGWLMFVCKVLRIPPPPFG